MRAWTIGGGLAAALTVGLGSASAQPKRPYPFVGKWDCQVGTFTFTDRTYHNGSETMRIRKVETFKSDFKLSFSDGYAIALFDVGLNTMKWHSLASGDLFDCRRMRPQPQMPTVMTERVFEASDAISIVDKILAAEPIKDQFETTAAFEKRKQQSLASALSGPDTKDAWYLAASSPGLRYDADAGVIFAVNISRLTLSDIETIVGRYEATNAFGASVAVTKRRIERRLLVWEPDGKAVIAIPASVEVVKPQWTDLRLAFFGSVAPSPLKRQRHTSTPKIDSPYEDDVTTYELMFRPSRVAVYNAKTNAVVTMLPLVECPQPHFSPELRPGKC